MENLSTGDVARVLQVSRDTVRRLCESNELNCERLTARARFRVHRDSLEQYAERQNIRLDWNALERKK